MPRIGYSLVAAVDTSAGPAAPTSGRRRLRLWLAAAATPIAVLLAWGVRSGRVATKWMPGGEAEAAHGGVAVGKARLVEQARREFARGHYFRRREERDDLERAVLHLHRSIAIDPTFAPAHALLAEVYCLQTEERGLGRQEGLLKGAFEASEALRLDSDLSEAHAAMAIVQFCLARDYPRAQRHFAEYLIR